MKKKLLGIEIKIVKSEKTTEKIIATISKIGNSQSAEIFQIVVSRNETILYNQDYISSRFGLIKLKIVDEIRTLIDSFDPKETSIEIIDDSHDLLKKVTMCCPDCGRKFFESWGRIKGIVTKCHRCRNICIPVEK